jgi:hypothetical protein
MRLRRALGPVAAVWLLCQAAALMLGPAAHLLGAVEAPAECTCLHGDHAICPMHHTPARGAQFCVMSADDNGVAVLTSILIGPGLVQEVVRPAPPPAELAAASRDITTRSLRPAPPDPPPPRA